MNPPRWCSRSASLAFDNRQNHTYFTKQAFPQRTTLAFSLSKNPITKPSIPIDPDINSIPTNLENSEGSFASIILMAPQIIPVEREERYEQTPTTRPDPKRMWWTPFLLCGSVISSPGKLLKIIIDWIIPYIKLASHMIVPIIDLDPTLGADMDAPHTD
jgi:hypothetical protein